LRGGGLRCEAGGGADGPLEAAHRRVLSAGERAFFVTAADDPADVHPAKFDIVFSANAKLVEAFGGSGAIPVSRRPDGSCAVPLASCGGVLLVVKPVIP
jgi:hypothetical protein